MDEREPISGEEYADAARVLGYALRKAWADLSAPFPLSLPGRVLGLIEAAGFELRRRP